MADREPYIEEEDFKIAAGVSPCFKVGTSSGVTPVKGECFQMNDYTKGCASQAPEVAQAFAEAGLKYEAWYEITEVVPGEYIKIRETDSSCRNK